jgi:hypothetical protein
MKNRCCWFVEKWEIERDETDLWIASKRRKTEEEQEDEKLMGVYNLRFF